MANHQTFKLLLFDTILTGHHSDYLFNLVDYWHTNDLPGELVVVTPRGLAATFPEEYLRISGLTFVEITDEEIRASLNVSSVRRSLAEWNLYVQYAFQIQPTHALLMYFDLFQLGAWIGRKSPCPVSGIYFRPSFHYAGAEKWREKLVALRKKYLLREVLKNKALYTLFSLDKTVVPAIRKMASTVRIVPLSDPVRYYKITSVEVEALRLTLGIDRTKKVFLLFGYLDDRKGIEQVLDAFAILTEEEQAQCALVIAGPIQNNFRVQIESKIASLHGRVQVVSAFQELKGANIQTYFELADYVLTLYQKHVGMSSIVIRAAFSEKPLISSDFGYLGELVKTNQLGLTVNSSSPGAISRAFSIALRGEVRYSLSALRKLAKENTAQSFAQQIFEGIGATTTLKPKPGKA